MCLCVRLCTKSYFLSKSSGAIKSHSVTALVYFVRSTERVMVEPAHLEEGVDIKSDGQDIKGAADLVIFDLNGTLLCTHEKHSQWFDMITKR